MTNLMQCPLCQQTLKGRAPLRRCEDCGQMFEPRRSDAMYCSDPCKSRAYRRREQRKRLLAAEEGTPNGDYYMPAL